MREYLKSQVKKLCDYFHVKEYDLESINDKDIYFKVHGYTVKVLKFETTFKFFIDIEWILLDLKKQGKDKIYYLKYNTILTSNRYKTNKGEYLRIVDIFRKDGKVRIYNENTNKGHKVKIAIDLNNREYFMYKGEKVNYKKQVFFPYY